MASIVQPAPLRAVRSLRLPGLARVATPRARKFAAVALAVVLLGYGLTLGTRYWNATSQTAELSLRSRELSRALTRPLPSSQAQAAALASAEARAKQIESLFNSATSDTLLTVVADSAAQAGLTLASVTMGEAKAEVFGAVQYQALPMTLVVNGAADSLTGYLSIVRSQYPAVAVSSIRTHRTGATENSRVTLQFYTDPKPVEKPVKKTP